MTHIPGLASGPRLRLVQGRRRHPRNRWEKLAPAQDRVQLHARTLPLLEQEPTGMKEHQKLGQGLPKTASESLRSQGVSTALGVAWGWPF